MNEDKKTANLNIKLALLMWLGVLILFAFLSEIIDVDTLIPIVVALLIAVDIIFIRGCIYYARSKGYDGVLGGILGLVGGLVGLFILMMLPEQW
ncbi:MAG TPA: hypothetical protein PLU88_10445 [Armatimonadota bacterium]|nr:hypothetical protein [Armatimonadota bacterium]